MSRFWNDLRGRGTGEALLLAWSVVLSGAWAIVCLAWIVWEITQ